MSKNHWKNPALGELGRQTDVQSGFDNPPAILFIMRRNKSYRRRRARQIADSNKYKAFAKTLSVKRNARVFYHIYNEDTLEYIREGHSVSHKQFFAQGWYRMQKTRYPSKIIGVKVPLILWELMKQKKGRYKFVKC